MQVPPGRHDRSCDAMQALSQTRRHLHLDGCDILQASRTTTSTTLMAVMSCRHRAKLEDLHNLDGRRHKEGRVGEGLRHF